MLPLLRWRRLPRHHPPEPRIHGFADDRNTDAPSAVNRFHHCSPPAEHALASVVGARGFVLARSQGFNCVTWVSMRPSDRSWIRR